MKRLRKYLPDHRAVRDNRWLAPFGGTLLHPRLWHLNRRSAAGGIAVGLFCGLIPGPFQMLGAAICAVLFRVNLPLALITTLYTNPLTIVPLYFVAFALGRATLGEPDGGAFTAPPGYGPAGLSAWIKALSAWMIGLGEPLALAGYVATRLAWRIYLVRQWHKRKAPID